MSEAQCLALLQRKITSFKKSCSEEKLKILNQWWPKSSVKNPCIGVMKLVPKVHKLCGPINEDSWIQLKSRPIRGAENDPIKDPSKALYGMLHSLLSSFRTRFPTLENNQNENFTELKGCDDYVQRLSLIELDSKKNLQTTLISADFSDAYTETGIEHLKISIKKVADLVKYEESFAEIMLELVDLVFFNCYFYTPFGLYRH